MKANYTKVCSANSIRVRRTTAAKPVSTHKRVIIALTELGEDVKTYRREAMKRMYNRMLANPNINH